MKQPKLVGTLTGETADTLSAHRSEEQLTRFLPVLSALQKSSCGTLTNIEYVFGRIECNNDGWLSVRGCCAQDGCTPEHGEND
jgi:hypothetical protein